MIDDARAVPNTGNYPASEIPTRGGIAPSLSEIVPRAKAATPRQFPNRIVNEGCGEPVIVDSVVVGGYG